MLRRLRELLRDLRDVPISRTHAWRLLGERYAEK
jgi:hypothetical protein